MLHKSKAAELTLCGLVIFQRRIKSAPIHILRLPGVEAAEKTVKLPPPCRELILPVPPVTVLVSTAGNS